MLNFINSKANFNLVRTIKSFNDTVANSKRMKFFGLDFEDRLNGKWTKKALQIISGEIKLPRNHPLQALLNAIIQGKPNSEKTNLALLKTYLEKNEQSSRLLLGKYYIDVLLISNAQFNFSPKRDKAMFANFKLLYNELTKKDKHPKFFASFGIGHINPKNKNGLPYRLLESKDSPIKGKVSVIGTQYFNCTFNVANPTLGPTGTLSSICKNREVKRLAISNKTKEKTITFFSKSELNNFECKKAINKLDGLFIVRNFDEIVSWGL